MSFSVKQNGNRVEIYGGSQTIFLKLKGRVCHPLHDFSSPSGLLPVAMRDGFDVKIDGPVDPVVADNARRFALLGTMVAGRFSTRWESQAVEPSHRSDGNRPRSYAASGGADLLDAYAAASGALGTTQHSPDASKCNGECGGICKVAAPNPASV